MNVPRIIATLGGVGYAPYAPGTAGSIVALPFAWLIAYGAGRFALMLAAVLALAIGAWASELYTAQTKRPDPSECVVDELAGQWIACAFAPTTLLGFGLAFLLFRLFDTWKPWPIRAVERLHGGIGVMADDVLAALVAGAILFGLLSFGLI
ncbi:MAG TPA: phosphatidylglycerophosphatase A [Rhizomicrobium sp.]|nr:phosphatidylglycerophosphatase A [Rhizomicrobium sp.]